MLSRPCRQLAHHNVLHLGFLARLVHVVYVLISHVSVTESVCGLRMHPDGFIFAVCLLQRNIVSMPCQTPRIRGKLSDSLMGRLSRSGSHTLRLYPLVVDKAPLQRSALQPPGAPHKLMKAGQGRPLLCQHARPLESSMLCGAS